jgi:hypothetical protein
MYFNIIIRVLQRLADKELLDGSKFPREKWETIIRNFLQNGGDDFGVYSLLRNYYIGKTLEESLKINIRSLNNSDSSNSSSGGDCFAKSEGNEEKEKEKEGGDGRANFMVEMTIECIPSVTSSKGNTKYDIFFIIMSVLSYLGISCLDLSSMVPYIVLLYLALPILVLSYNVMFCLIMSIDILPAGP